MAKRRFVDGKIERRRQHVSMLLCTMARPSIRRVQDALRSLTDPITVSKSTVARDIEAIRTEWKEARLTNADEYIGEELEKLRLLEERAWHALNQSMTGSEETIMHTRVIPVRTADGDLEQREVVDRRVVQRQGRADARLIRNLVEIQERRAKLLGLDAPKGIDLTSGGEELVFRIDIGEGQWTPPVLGPEEQQTLKALRSELDDDES